MVLETLSAISTGKKISSRYGEETLWTLSGTFQLKPSTSLSVSIPSLHSPVHLWLDDVRGLFQVPVWLQKEWRLLEIVCWHDWLTMPSRPREEELDSSMVWSMSTERHSLRMVLPVSTKVSLPQLSASSSTMVSTSVSMTVTGLQALGVRPIYSSHHIM